MSITKVPLVSSETLQVLEESLNGELGLCRNFVSRFIDMWPGRFERIHEAITTAHQEDAMDAALSLRSSSMMVGGARLGAMATDIIALLEYEAYAQAATKLATLQRCGNQTTRQLKACYVNAA
ncbi:hypothetical protein ACFUCV_01185 [Specibacter sp. NPDC057265]|uniref:hypothetical protein n=1 Tax=Specibacter sp. NPDC057265 TaxID=3346075 RepID=UPI003642F634